MKKGKYNNINGEYLGSALKGFKAWKCSSINPENGLSPNGIDQGDMGPKQSVPGPQMATKIVH